MHARSACTEDSASPVGVTLMHPECNVAIQLLDGTLRFNFWMAKWIRKNKALPSALWTLKGGGGVRDEMYHRAGDSDL